MRRRCAASSASSSFAGSPPPARASVARPPPPRRTPPRASRSALASRSLGERLGDADEIRVRSRRHGRPRRARRAVPGRGRRGRGAPSRRGRDGGGDERDAADVLGRRRQRAGVDRLVAPRCARSSSRRSASQRSRPPTWRSGGSCGARRDLPRAPALLAQRGPRRGPLRASMRRTLAALELSLNDPHDTDLGRRADVRAAAQLAREAPSPISTIRTISPYFSPNSAIAPSARASSRVVVIGRTGMVLEDPVVDLVLDVAELFARSSRGRG